eukprot:11407695-Prorocentrum_lima.AAC.1
MAAVSVAAPMAAGCVHLHNNAPPQALVGPARTVRPVRPETKLFEEPAEAHALLVVLDQVRLP